ncbi:MAG: hypothetical protein KC501_20700 [Myxococcales bacterium]|nr:hypothetical protein [Myxococcales bacterium]
MPSIRRIVLLGLVGATLAAGGCDSGKPEAKKDGDAKTAKAGDAKTGDAAKAGDAKTDEAADGDEAKADEAPDALDDRVVKAASLAKKIEAEPTRADAILEEAGMDRESFEALIFEVSTPELAEQYRLAMAREG